MVSRSSGRFQIEWIPGTDNGRLFGEGVEVEQTLGSIKCYYGGKITQGLELKDGWTLSMAKVAVEKRAGSTATCANPAKWSAVYSSGLSTPVYVEQR
jgi:hypothetical protein